MQRRERMLPADSTIGVDSEFSAGGESDHVIMPLVRRSRRGTDGCPFAVNHNDDRENIFGRRCFFIGEETDFHAVFSSDAEVSARCVKETEENRERALSQLEATLCTGTKIMSMRHTQHDGSSIGGRAQLGIVGNRNARLGLIRPARPVDSFDCVGWWVACRNQEPGPLRQFLCLHGSGDKRQSDRRRALAMTWRGGRR